MPDRRRRGPKPNPAGLRYPVRLQIPCTREMRDEMLTVCEMEGVTVAAVLRGLAERWLTDYQEGTPYAR